METLKYDEISKRIEKLQSYMRKEGVNSCLILQNVDLFYFSGTIQKAYLFVPDDDEPILFVQKNFDRANRESPIKNIVHIERPKLISQIIKKQGNLKKIGLEFDVLPVNIYMQLKRIFPHSEFMDVSKQIKEIRMIKSPYEISLLRHSAKILDDVFSYAKKIIKPEMTEIDVESILIEFGRRKGHQGITRMRTWNQDMVNASVLAGKSGTVLTHLDVSVIGPGISPAFPQGSSYNKIEKNVPIQIDFSIAYNGYITDGTRTYVIGSLPERLKEAYKVGLELRDEMERIAKPGILCSEIYYHCTRIVKKNGLEEYFIGTKKDQAPFVGHGIGLEIDELPLIARGFPKPLQPGMVFAFEPKFIFPEIGVIALEDDYVVTENGVDRLTQAEDGIIYIENA